MNFQQIATILRNTSKTVDAQDIETFQLAIKQLRQYFTDEKEITDVVVGALEEEIAIAKANRNLSTFVFGDDPVYRFDATYTEFESFLTDPHNYLLTYFNLDIAISDLIVIGRYGVVKPGQFCRVFGIPGTKVVTVTVSSKWIPGILDADGTSEHVLFDYVKGPDGKLSDRVFIHQQLIKRSQEIPNDSDSLRLTRKQSAKLAAQIICQPTKYVASIPQSFNGSKEKRKYQIVPASSTSTTTGQPSDLDETIKFTSIAGSIGIARGFVLELNTVPSFMCAVTEMENLKPTDPPGSKVAQEFNVEQLIIKSY